jgi:hypothetical protein
MKLRKARVALAGAPLAVLVALVASFAPSASAVETTESTATIEIFLQGKKMGFSGPTTVHEGEVLKVVNDTTPSQVGPHTFSLVTQSSLPKTAKQRKTCFTPGKICMGIAGWYGLKGEENPKNPLVQAGGEGWNTMGTVKKKGDSYFFGKKGESFEQPVTAKAGTTLYFMCAVHAFMQGSIKVLPPATQ